VLFPSLQERRSAPQRLKYVPSLKALVVNEHLRLAIRKRARQAVTKDDLVQAVFDGFRGENIELRSVSLEEMKAAIVCAAGAARARLPAAA
jgi:hypothetical protein